MLPCAYFAQKLTSWHIVSGRHFQTERTLSSKGAVPDRVRSRRPLSRGMTVGLVSRRVFARSASAAAIGARETMQARPRRVTCGGAGFERAIGKARAGTVGG